MSSLFSRCSDIYGIFHLVELEAFGDRHCAFNTWITDSGVRSMGLEVLKSSDVAADVGIVEGAEVGLVG